nr:hypothetical protein [Acutalibacter muris]
MTAQEKQVTLQNLQIVTGIFQEFEEAFDMVVSLPNQKRTALSTPEEMDELFQDTLQHASPLATSLQMFTMGSPLKYTMIVYLAAYFIAIIPAFMAGRLVGMLFGKSAIMTVYMILSIIGTIYIGKFIKKQINKIIHSGDKRLQDKIRGYQEAADRHNAEIDRQIAIAQKKCDEVRQKIARLDMSWYPPHYCCADASAFFYKALINGMCETLGEAAVLYEEHLFRNRVLANQQEQIRYAYQQCILQGQTMLTLRDEFEKTRGTIHDEHDKTRGTIHAEHEATRGRIHDEGEATRGAIHAEGEATRGQMDKQYKDLRRRTGR